jgi:hypothetical protein
VEYFLMRQDRRYGNTPHFKGVFSQFNMRDLCLERCNRIAEETTIEVEPNKGLQYLDLLDIQLFMVSTKLRKLLAMYEPELIFKRISIIDYSNGRNEIYWLPILEDVDCIAPQSEFNRDKSVLLKIALNEAAINDQSIFRLAGVATPYIVARLDLVESILRRDFEGIKFTRLEVQNAFGVKNK